MKTFALGPDDALLGAVTPATEPQHPPLGALIWGLGIAEMLLARRLARAGIPSIQLRVNGDAFLDDARRNALYDRQGIVLCRAAMDHLEQAHGTSRFIAVGNCATGSLVLNAALADERIAAVVPTNLHFEGLGRPFRARLRRIVSADAWRRLMSGELSAARAVARFVNRQAPNGAAAPDSSGGSRPACYDGDFWIGRDLPARLEQLVARGVAIHLVCTRNDDSRIFLQGRFRGALRALLDGGRVTLSIIDRDVHVFSRDELAANDLNESICAWLAGLADVACPAAYG